MSNYIMGKADKISEKKDSNRYRALFVEAEHRSMAIRADRDKLRKAIRNHRRNLWGDGPVGHDEDIELYAALEEKPNV